MTNLQNELAEAQEANYTLKQENMELKTKVLKLEEELLKYKTLQQKPITPIMFPLLPEDRDT